MSQGETNCPFLMFTGRAAERRRHDQIGLAAEKCRNLQHVHDLGDGRHVGGLMHVGQHRNVHFVFHLFQNAQAFLHPRPAKTADRGAVRLVVGRLEDEGEIQRARHALDDLRHAQRVLFALDDARARDQEQDRRRRRERYRFGKIGHGLRPIRAMRILNHAVHKGTRRKINENLLQPSCLCGYCIFLRLPPPHFFRPQEHLDLGRCLSAPSFLPVLVRSADERLEQRMRLQRLRLELGMELAADEITDVRESQPSPRRCRRASIRKSAGRAAVMRALRTRG